MSAATHTTPYWFTNHCVRHFAYSTVDSDMCVQSCAITNFTDVFTGPLHIKLHINSFSPLFRQTKSPPLRAYSVHSFSHLTGFLRSPGVEPGFREPESHVRSNSTTAQTHKLNSQSIRTLQVFFGMNDFGGDAKTTLNCIHTYS